MSRDPIGTLAASRLDKETEAQTGHLDSIGSVVTMSAADHHPDRWTSLRVIDANANRAAEGLRVVEEFARFAIDDPHLSQQCKQLRHDLAAAVAPIGASALLSRDAPRDVGRNVETQREYDRPTMLDIVCASFNRVQQALRCLEEYGKRIDPELGRRFEQLRYRSYELESAIHQTAVSQQRLQDARLYVLIDGGRSADDFEQRAALLVESGVHLIQLRDKRLDDGELLERARTLRRLTAESTTGLIINDRADIAALCHADGVHLGQTDIQVADARRIVGPDALLGVSTHSVEQARQAVTDGANYIGVGPTFPSLTKSFASYEGVELLEHVHAEVRLPAFAIGGIDLDRLAQVQRTGFERVAVGAAIWQAANPSETVRQFLDTLATPVCPPIPIKTKHE